MKLKIKKGDKVKVIAGADKGTPGTVLEVLPRIMKVRVQGVRVQTHFDKKEGVLKKEGLIDYSNVALVEKSAAKKTAKKSASKSK